LLLHVALLEVLLVTWLPLRLHLVREGLPSTGLGILRGCLKPASKLSLLVVESVDSGTLGTRLGWVEDLALLATLRYLRVPGWVPPLLAITTLVVLVKSVLAFHLKDTRV
jgi:hypothetical protein